MTQRMTEKALKLIRGLAADGRNATEPAPINVDRLTALLDEIDARGEDVKYLLSEFGHEHWRNCDDDDCYLCDGYAAIRDQYKVNP
jgi:hypothetical protein